MHTFVPWLHSSKQQLPIFFGLNKAMKNYGRPIIDNREYVNRQIALLNSSNYKVYRRNVCQLYGVIMRHDTMHIKMKRSTKKRSLKLGKDNINKLHHRINIRRVRQLLDNIRNQHKQLSRLNDDTNLQLSLDALYKFIDAVSVVLYIANNDCLLRILTRRESSDKAYAQRVFRIVKKVSKKYNYSINLVISILSNVARYLCLPNVAIYKRKAYEQVQRANEVIYRTHNNFRKMINKKNNHGRLHRQLTAEKRALRSQINSMITDRQCIPFMDPNKNTAVNRIAQHGKNNDAKYRPAKNYARHIAETELVTSLLSKWSLDKLLSFYMEHLYFLDDAVSIETCILPNTTEIMDRILKMMSSRLKTKLLLVNEPYCTCQAKCHGWTVASNVPAGMMFNTLLGEHATIQLCGACLLSPNSLNTKARRPCIRLNAYNHHVNSCSIDGTATFRPKLLYNAVWNSSLSYQNHVRYTYGHVFHANSTINVTESLAGSTKLTGTATRFFGICHGGKRTCYQIVRSYLPSAAILRKNEQQYRHKLEKEEGAKSSDHKQDGIDGDTYLEHVRTRLTCKSCSTIHGNWNSDTSSWNTSMLIGGSRHDQNTCIVHIFQYFKQWRQKFKSNDPRTAIWSLEEENEIARILCLTCDGCKIRLQCKHIQENILKAYRVNTSSNARDLIIKRLLYYKKVQSILISLTRSTHARTDEIANEQTTIQTISDSQRV